MRRVLGILILAILTLGVAACGGSNTTTEGNTTTKAEQETLTVGLECAYAPFNWTENTKTETNYPIDGTNKFAEGYDVQIAKKIADGLNRRLVIKQLAWDGLIPAVTNGMIDLIIAGMSPTDERKVDIDFTNAYYTSEHVVLVAADSEFANVTSVDGFTGATFIGQIGTLYKDIVEGMDGITIGNHKATVPEIITDIQNGIVDGTVLELPVAQGIVGANADLKLIQFTAGNGFVVAEEDKTVSIGLEKGSDLLASINEILAGITNEQRVTLMQEAVARQAE